MEQIYIKRIYEPYKKNDGYRILVDRLWPRGISKADAKINQWAKAFAPSSQLRGKIHQQEINWQQFAEKYRQELIDNPEFEVWKETLLQTLPKSPVTFITAAKLLPVNHAEILKTIITENTAG